MAQGQCALNSSAVQVPLGRDIGTKAECQRKCNTYINSVSSMHDQSLFRKEGEKLDIILYHLDKNTNILLIAR